jgi:hypothetical protein
MFGGNRGIGFGPRTRLWHPLVTDRGDKNCQERTPQFMRLPRRGGDDLFFCRARLEPPAQENP